MSDRVEVTLEPWSEDDFALLEQTVGDPQMMAHLGGAEAPEQMARRQDRFSSRTQAGSRSSERTWRGEDVYETGSWNAGKD
jgi:hypothetical protein